MRKSLILLPLFSSVVISCVKENGVVLQTEEQIPETNTFSNNTISLMATISDVDEDNTKTTYDINEETKRATFYWNGDESFVRAVRYNEGKKYYDKDIFTSSGSKTTSRLFSCESPKTDDATYEDTKIAFYPYNDGNPNGANISFDTQRGDAHFYYSIGSQLAFNSSAPLDGIVPMVGLYDEENNAYDFKALTGVLALRMTGIPASATKLTISSASNTYKMGGKTTKITDQTNLETLRSTIANYSYTKGLSQSLLASELSYSKTYTFSSLDPGTEYAFYFPMPISANHNSGTTTLNDLTVTVYNALDEVLYTTNTDRALTIQRGYITRLPLISIPSVSVRFGGTAMNPTATIYFGDGITKVKYGYAMEASQAGTPYEVTASGTTTPALGKGYSYQYYFKYQAYNGDDPVGEAVTLRYWALSSDENTVICKTHTATLGYKFDTNKEVKLKHNAPFADKETASICFAPSDDPGKGNLMITNFCGVAGKAYAQYSALYKDGSWKAVDNPIITLINSHNLNHPFCRVNGTAYYLHHDDLNKNSEFRIAAKKYNTSDYYSFTVYGVCTWTFLCWNHYIGLTPSNSSYSSNLEVEYFGIVPTE